MDHPWLILSVIAAYFIVWLIVSFLSSKGANDSTFFNGNRKMPWPVVAVAMLGAPISGVTFISVPGMVMTKGFSYLQMCMGFFVGYLVIAFVLVPVYYKLNIVSIYEFLKQRFGRSSYKTGAWLFFVSKLFGISVRFLVVCAMLQFLVFEPLGIPYFASVLVSLCLVWVSTYKGGVKSVIWSDVLKSFCLLASIGLCLYFVAAKLDVSVFRLPDVVGSHDSSKILFFDDPSDSKFFWKQFVAGIFLVVAMTGLDQDMMQRTLACRNARDARKNLIAGSMLQTLVIGLLLLLGSSMMIFLESTGQTLPEKSDSLFATVVMQPELPFIAAVLFIIGLISATFSSVASALTSMTTTATIDLMEYREKNNPDSMRSVRTYIHTGISVAMALLVMLFFYLNDDDAISMVYTLVSYTDGPILGLFLFGLLTKRRVNERWLPAACFMAPVFSWLTQWVALNVYGYQIGYELLILNAGFTWLGLYLLSRRRRSVDLVAPVGEP